MTSIIEEPHAPLGETIGFGNPFHGWLQGGALYRLDGAAMTLPAGIQHFPVADGSARLIDLSQPAVTTSDAEKAKGMTWWNKALLCGCGMSAAERTYNPVHGSNASAIQFRRGCWPYRCADGTVYLIWYSTSGEKKIRAEKIGAPMATIPPNPTGGIVCLDLAGVVPDTRVVGAFTFNLFWWINFAPNGNKAALHSGYVDGSTRYTYQIVEFAITGGSADTLPTVTQTSLKSLEAGGGLNIDGYSSTVVDSAEMLLTHYAGYKYLKAGEEITTSTVIVCVDYDAAGQRAELAMRTSARTVYTTYDAGAPYWDQRTETFDGWYIDKNGSPVLTVQYSETVQTTLDPVTKTQTVANPFPAMGSMELINGNVVVVTAPRATTAASGLLNSVTVSLYAAVSANATAGDAKTALATGINATDIAINPQTGAFVAGRTRYF